VAKEPTTIQQIQKLDQVRARLVETAKADALTRAQEAVDELTALGFEYELTEIGKEHKPARKARATAARTKIDHRPRGTCPICEYATSPPHDKRSHRMQTKKKPFTDAELSERGMKIVA
jgi:hypothetical protein